MLWITPKFPGFTSQAEEVNPGIYRQLSLRELSRSLFGKVFTACYIPLTLIQMSQLLFVQLKQTQQTWVHRLIQTSVRLKEFSSSNKHSIDCCGSKMTALMNEENFYIFNRLFGMLVVLNSTLIPPPFHRINPQTSHDSILSVFCKILR